MSSLTTSANHVEQLFNKTPTEDLSQILIKEFLTQNKSTIEGNQLLIDELRSLRGVIAKQNEEFLGMKQNIRKIEDATQQNHVLCENILNILKNQPKSVIVNELPQVAVKVQQPAVITPVKIEDLSKKEPVAPVTNGKIDFGGFVANKNLPSFADLAKNTTAAATNPSGFTFGASSDNKPSLFGNVQQQLSSTPLANAKFQSPLLFGNQFAAVKPADENGEEGDDGNANPEEYEPDVDFKPLVQLKEVEVKTGEEDEEVVFKERCKLYRFATETKEWKEKGVGEMKILKHKENHMYRVLMRRDQVLKLCANHRILPDIKLEIATEKQIRWSTTDYSESESKYECLLAKFRHEDEAKRFINAFEKAQQNYSSSPVKQQSTTQVNVANGKPSLAESLKIDKGTWSCTDCLAPNKPESNKCACCQKERVDVNKPATPVVKQPQFQQTSTTSTPTLFTNGNHVQNTQPAPFSFGNVIAKTQEASPAVNGTPGIVAFGSKNLPGFGDLAKSSAGSGFLFGNTDNKASPFGAAPTAQLFGAASKQSPLLFGNQFQAVKPADENGEEGGDEGNANPEEYEPDVDFKPLVQLKEVEVKTGEEDEDVMFKERCKLFRFSPETKEWKEKGVGEMKILKHKENHMYRVLMRRDQVLKLCANHRILPDIKLEVATEKQIRWSTTDYSESEAKYECLLAKFRHEDEAKRFKAEFEKAQKNYSSSPVKQPQSKPTETKTSSISLPALSELIKVEKGTWSCTQCLVANKPDSDKCACCQSPRDGAAVPTSTSASANLNAQSEFKPAPINPAFKFGSDPTPANGPSKLSFAPTVNIGNLVNTASTTSTQTPPATFGSNLFAFAAKPASPATLTPQATAPSFGFGTKTDLPGFGDLAKSSAGSGFLFGNTDNKASPFGAAPTAQLFGAASKQSPLLFGNQFQAVKPTDENGEEGDEGNANPEEYEPVLDFKPLVQLKEVEVKTGEEDEDVMFKERCKLFRFSPETKEWKEKGVGEMKILKHKENHMYRVLMRRDQVLKLCANHRILPDIKLEVATEKQIRWSTTDYSESESKYEILLAKFRHEDEAKRFKAEFEKAQQNYSSSPVKQPTSSTTTTSNVQNGKPSLAESLKIEKGTWSCSQCLVQNKPDTNVCGCCKFVRLNSTDNKKADDDVCVLNEVKATQDQINRAKKYNLPENFYLYESKQNCSGCRGCSRED